MLAIVPVASLRPFQAHYLPSRHSFLVRHSLDFFLKFLCQECFFWLGVWYELGFVLPPLGPFASELSGRGLLPRLPFVARLPPCPSTNLVVLVDTFPFVLRRSSYLTFLPYSLTALALGVTGCLWSEARDLACPSSFATRAEAPSTDSVFKFALIRLPTSFPKAFSSFRNVVCLHAGGVPSFCRVRLCFHCCHLWPSWLLNGYTTTNHLGLTALLNKVF